MKIALVLAACLVAAQAACPDLSVVDPFDVEKFAGTWYNQKATLGTVITQGFGSCSQAVYTLNSTTGVVSVVNSQKSLLKTTVSIEGSAVLADSSKTEAKLNVTLSTPIGERTSSLSVLATDYDNFAISYSCRTILGRAYESAWILTRTQVLEDEEKVEVEALISAALDTISSEGGPELADFRTISQENC